MSGTASRLTCVSGSILLQRLRLQRFRVLDPSQNQFLLGCSQTLGETMQQPSYSASRRRLCCAGKHGAKVLKFIFDPGGEALFRHHHY